MIEHLNSPGTNNHFTYCFFSKQYYFHSYNVNDNSFINSPEIKASIRQICHYFAKTHLALMGQTHSNRVRLIRGEEDLNSENNQFDAQITTSNDIILGVLSADCLPILIADASSKVVAAIHAGWRGALGGIIENTLDKMESLGCSLQNLRCYLGPAIHQSSYQVDEEFRRNFLSKSREYNKFFIKDNNESGKYFFDLIGFTEEKLLARGVRNIYNESIDTYKNPERWPSHRRMMGQSSVKNNDQAPQQRFISAICLN